MIRYPYGRQSITAAEIDAVVDILKGDWLTTGPAVGAFEEKICTLLQAPFAVACSSGTAGLHMAMLALGLGPGDQVIVPGITFVATANAVRLVGAEVIFADVDPDTGLSGVEEIERAHKAMADPSRLAAIVTVHLAGQSTDIVQICAYARMQGCFLIEDACHALGSLQGPDSKSYPVGGCHYSDMAVFSFHPVKTVTTAEGGAVTTRSADRAEKLRLYRSHGISRRETKFIASGAPKTAAAPWYYEQQLLGLNYRLNDMQAALGKVQLSRLAVFTKKRSALMRCYASALSGFSPSVKMLAKRSDHFVAWHLCAVLIDFDRQDFTRGELMAQLAESGIGTQVHYIPLYRQPYYHNRYGKNSLPGCERYYARQLSLPLYPGLEPEDILQISQRLKELLS